MEENRVVFKIIGDESSLAEALRRGKTDIATFTSQVQNATAPFRSLISAAFSLKTALAGIVSGVGIAAVSTSLIRAGQEVDRLRVSFGSISGSSQGAAKEMEFVRSTADKLGLDLQSAAQAYKGIDAAAQGTTLAGKPVRDIFTAVAKASTALGLSAENTSGSLLAISQMISKGTVSAEELRGQLGERLPGAFNIAARAMGVSTAKLGDMMQKGEVFSTDFLPKFAKALEEQFGTAAGKAANGFTAAENRISTAVSLLKGNLGQAVTNNTFFTTAMGMAAAAINVIGKDVEENAGAWRQWAKESAISVLQFAVDAAGALNDVYKTLNYLGGASLTAFAGIAKLGQGVQLLFEMENVLAGNFEKAAYWAKAQKDTANLAAEAMVSADKKFQAAAEGSSSLVAITERLTQLQEGLKKVAADPVNPIEGSAKAAELEVTKINGVLVVRNKAIVASTNQTTTAAAVHWQNLGNAVTTAMQKAAENGGKALGTLEKPRIVSLTVDKNTSTIKAAGEALTALQVDAQAKATIATSAIGNVVAATGAGIRQSATMSQTALAELKNNIVLMEQKVAQGGATEQQFAKIEALKAVVQEAGRTSAATTENIMQTATSAIGNAVAATGSGIRQTVTLSQTALEQLKGNIAAMDKMVAEGGATEQQVDQIKAIKAVADEAGKAINNLGGDWKKTADTAEKESGDSTDAQKRDVSELTKAIHLVDGQWVTYGEAAKDASKSATVQMLEDLAKVKRAADDVRDSWTLNNNTTNSQQGMSGLKRGGMVQALASGGSVLRNILAGGHLPGFGGGDTVPLMGERGEVMINKYAVQAGGLKAALAFNSGNWAVVISELMKRTKTNINDMIGYKLGGIVGMMQPVQALAGGGEVSGSAAKGSGMIRHEHILRVGNTSAKVYTDDLNAGRLLAVFERARRMAS